MIKEDLVTRFVFTIRPFEISSPSALFLWYLDHSSSTLAMRRSYPHPRVAGNTQKQESRSKKGKVTLSSWFSSTKVGRRFRHLAVAVVASGAVIAGSAAFATPALAAYPEYHCPTSSTSEFQNTFVGVWGCTIVWYNRSVGVSMTALSPYIICMDGYVGNTEVDGRCGGIFYGTLEYPGDTTAISKVYIEEYTTSGQLLVAWPVPRPD